MRVYLPVVKKSEAVQKGGGVSAYKQQNLSSILCAEWICFDKSHIMHWAIFNIMSINCLGFLVYRLKSVPNEMCAR